MIQNRNCYKVCFSMPDTNDLTKFPGSLKQGLEAEEEVTGLSLWTEMREVLMVTNKNQTGHQMPQWVTNSRAISGGIAAEFLGT